MPKKLTPLRSQPCQDCRELFNVYHRFQARCEPCQTLFRNTRKKEYNKVCESCAAAFKARSCRAKQCPDCAAKTTCKHCGSTFEKQTIRTAISVLSSAATSTRQSCILVETIWQRWNAIASVAVNAVLRSRPIFTTLICLADSKRLTGKGATTI